MSLSRNRSDTAGVSLDIVRQGVPWPERLRWAAAQPGLRHAASTVSSVDVGEQLRRWRDVVAPHGGTAFGRRLERAGLTPTTALLALGETEPVAPQPPSWSPWLELLVAAGATGTARPLAHGERWLLARAAELPDGADREIPFAHLFWPVCVAAWAHLQREAALGLSALAPAAVTDLRRGLLARCAAVAAPTLTEALWEGVPYGQRLLSRLGLGRAEDATRLRYAAFCRTTSDTAWADVLATYPVLGSVLATVLRQWTAATTELLGRLQRDRVALHAAFGIPTDVPLEAVRLAAGDTHNDGRSVSVLVIGGRRVVYKPRDMRLEAFLATLVDRLRARAPDAAVRVPSVLTREDADGDQYGYAEFVPHRPSRDEAELRGFYRDAGRVLALVDVLAGTDCHHENLVAHGDRLVLVDAETMLDELPWSDCDAGLGLDGDPASDPAASVLRTGLLPGWMWLPALRRVTDLSALGVRVADAGAGAGAVATGWRCINTDLMTRGRTRVGVGQPSSLPTTDGTPAVGRFVEELVAGFREAAAGIADVAGDVLPPLMDRLAACSRRVVPRPTYVYAGLLQASLEPEAMRSRTARGMVLERLTRGVLDAEPAIPWAVLVAEQEALARLDIPYFAALPSGGGVRWHDGEIEGWPRGDGIAALRSRVAAGVGRLDRKVQLVRAAVTSSEYRMTSLHPDAEATLAAPAGTTADPCAVARSWLGSILGSPPGVDVVGFAPSLLPDGVHVSVRPVGPGLYDGRVGLAVALYETALLLVDEKLRAAAADAAARAVAPVLERLASAPDGARRAADALGVGIIGVGGLLRGLAFLRSRGHIDDDLAVAGEAALLQGLGTHHLHPDRPLDRLLGTAGIVTPLFARKWTDDHLDVDVDVARLLRTAADVLLSRQDPVTGGWSTIDARAPLTGVAHGASGVALALAEAAVALADERFLAGALRGLAYERNVFDVRAGNWPDYRANARTGGFMLGWCAGAPGIALTRLRLLELLPDHDEASRWREELTLAAGTTAAAGLAARDHICCGATGRVAVLRTLAAAEGGDGWSAAADGVAAAVLRRAGGGPPATLLGRPPDGVAPLGLMTGVSGVAIAALSPDPTPWVTSLLL